MKTTMNKHVIFLSAAAVLLLSCSREADQVIQPGETITFTAAWAGSDETRTILQSDGTSVWWDATEQINVFFSDKASGKFTSTNSQPQAIVDFQGSLPIVVGSVETENPPHAYWAVYPYNSANTCDGGSVTLTVPATQTAKEGTFADKMFPSIATSTNFYLAFYNVCGGVRFTVANEGIASVTFKANNGEALAGKVKVGFDGTPVIKSVIEGASEVVVNAPTGGFVPGKYYFATLLPQTLTKGVSLTFTKSDGKVASTSLDNSITINRSRFGKMDEKDKGLEFENNPEDAIVFADSKVKEKLVAAFDTNGDGELSYAEAAAVKSASDLKNAFGSIKTYISFNEFQYFTGITSLANSMFENWNLLSSITLPPALWTTGSSAFKGCVKLQTLALPEGLLVIGDNTFYNCSSLASITIPESVVNIRDYAFYSCSSLSEISLPKGLTQLEKYAFYGCSSLTSIVVPEKITGIGEYTFYGCSNLTSISIPESVWQLRDYAFKGCSSLTDIIIPEGVTYIGKSAFSGCSSLSSINIPNGIKVIYEGTFYLCSHLTSITLPPNITRIDQEAFSVCSRLMSVVIPESVSTIGYGAFSYCYNLANITIPESVTSIGQQAFISCSNLTEITIPESVMSLGKNAFTSCTSLTSIIIKPETPPTGGNKWFEDTNNAPIYVPSTSVEIYKEASGWSAYADRIQPIQ